MVYGEGKGKARTRSLILWPPKGQFGVCCTRPVGIAWAAEGSVAAVARGGKIYSGGEIGANVRSPRGSGRSVGVPAARATSEQAQSAIEGGQAGARLNRCS